MKKYILMLCGGLMAGSAALGQLRVDVALIDVVATVTDDRGRYVPDLTADDFILEEDGKVQKISYVSQSDDIPISLGIVLDTSGSMERKIATATSAVERFIRTIHPEDDIFLMTFSNYVDLVQDFTDSRAKLSTALRRINVQGGTAMYDALDEGLRHLKRGTHSKKAILLISDGLDRDSRISLAQAEQYVRESEYLVYSMGISPASFGPMSERFPPVLVPGRAPTNPSPFPGSTTGGGIRLPGGITIPLPGSRRLSPAAPFQQPRQIPQTNPQGDFDSVDMQVLNDFADVSGARAWLVNSALNDIRGNELERILDELANELRNQYSVGYYPTHPIDDKKWHRVELRAKNSRYHVRARKDYFGD